MRYRRPSMNQLLGVTAAKRRVRRSLGVSQVEAWTEPSRVKQRVKYNVGFYSPAMSTARKISRGKFRARSDCGHASGSENALNR